MASLAAGGKLIQIGVLTGFGSKPDVTPLQFLNADIVGVTVGSRMDLELVSEFFSDRMLAPVIDSIFAFKDISKSLERLKNGQHFGKIVLCLDQ